MTAPQQAGFAVASGELSFRRRWHGDREVLPTDFRWHGRPLVVIDPEDAATLDALGKAWDEAESCDLDNEHPMTMRALRMRVALRALANPQPPKPEEPTGLGAVVEDAEGQRWVRCNGYWDREEGDNRGSCLACVWTDLAAVRVLSEGWRA